MDLRPRVIRKTGLKNHFLKNCHSKPAHTKDLLYELGWHEEQIEKAEKNTMNKKTNRNPEDKETQNREQIKKGINPLKF